MPWFAHDRMQDIVAALQADGSELAQATLQTLSEKVAARHGGDTKAVAAGADFVVAGSVSGAGNIGPRCKYFASDDFREGCAPP